MFVTPEANRASSNRVSPSLSVESIFSPKRLSTSSSPVAFGSLLSLVEGSAKLHNAVSPPKISSRSCSPHIDFEKSTAADILREMSPIRKPDGDKRGTGEENQLPIITKLSPSLKISSPKCKENNDRCDSEATAKSEANEICTCWRKPLIDQIFITDVTSNLVTVTVRECYTDKGFFRKRS